MVIAAFEIRDPLTHAIGTGFFMSTLPKVMHCFEEVVPQWSFCSRVAIMCFKG
jgi:hypothetical protein